MSFSPQAGNPTTLKLNNKMMNFANLYCKIDLSSTSPAQFTSCYASDKGVNKPVVFCTKSGVGNLFALEVDTANPTCPSDYQAVNVYAAY